MIKVSVLSLLDYSSHKPVGKTGKPPPRYTNSDHAKFNEKLWEAKTLNLTNLNENGSRHLTFLPRGHLTTGSSNFYE